MSTAIENEKSSSVTEGNPLSEDRGKRMIGRKTRLKGEGAGSKFVK